MRNLEILHQFYKHHDFIKDAIENESDLSEIQWTIINNSNFAASIFEVAIVCNERLYQVSLFKENDIKCVLLPKYENSKIVVVGIEYCQTTQQLYLAYESGEIIRVNPIRNPTEYNEEEEEEEDSQICEHDLVIKFDTKLRCMKGRPNFLNQTIAMVTDEGTVIVMWQFERKISEINLHLSDFGEKQFITVGWGKKETQFHGSEGKMAAKAKPEQFRVNRSDDGRPRISWRENGSFAVSFVHATTNVRQFKVFNSEGILQYTSEPTDGLEECLAWKPSGDLIVSTCQRYDNCGNTSEHVITCFEKNGLNHNYEHPSIGQRITVKDLFWSPDSEILTVICKHLDTDSVELQLWTENNCTWYLKQVMVFHKDDPLIHAIWNKQTFKRYTKELILLTLQGLMYCHFIWRVNHNKCETTNDKAVIGVIQGQKVLLTNFKDAIVPPPMGQTHVMLKEPVNAIIFAPNYSAQVDSNDKRTSWMNCSAFCTVSCSNTLTFFKEIPTHALKYEMLNTYNIECDIPDIKKCIKFGRIHHFLWLTEKSMLCIATGNSYQCSYLCEIILHKIDTENGRVMIRQSHKLDFDAIHLVPTHDKNMTYLMEANVCARTVIKNDSSHTSLDCEESYSIKQIDEFEFEAEWDNYYQVEHTKINSGHVLFVLSRNNDFYIELTYHVQSTHRDVTSFYVHSAFLLFTTEDTLFCVPLSESGLEQLEIYNVRGHFCDHRKRGIYMRQIERNSRIVAAIPHTSKVILQAPRGNLECIRPRPMSLHIIGCHLDECNYRTAFEIMRLERINLNLIYDHNPQLFMENAKKFVNDIADNPTWLTQFLADLQNENIIKTMYEKYLYDYYVRPKKSLGEDEDDKVERVCELLRNIMEQLDATRLIEPILISLVKPQYPNKEGLERALEKVKSIKIMEDSQKSVSAYNALRCLLHLVNIDELYNIALGMYDFELTMFIASNSLKDPKEYVPFLNSLRNLSDENYMKYSINMHLKRYKSALEHISKVPSKFDECLNLTRDQKLYQSAMKMFEKSSMEHKKLAALYAEYLLTERKHHQAGTMFYRSGDLHKALQAFSKSAGSWQEAIMVSTELKLSPTDLHEFYRELVKQLQAERMYSDAATVLKDYLNDTEEAVAILCEGRIWKRAIRIALDIERLDLIETHIKPGLKEHAEDVLSNLSKKKELFLKFKTRLVLVRKETKQKVPCHTAEYSSDVISEQIYNDRSRGEVMDVLSDASSDTTFSRQSSQISSTSGKSYRSRKKARKHASKILRIKEGDIFEDVKLVFELHKIISDIYKDRDETTQLVHLLVRFEFDIESENILSKTKEFFQVVKRSIPEIWDNSTSLDRLAKFVDTLFLQENIADFNPQLSCTKYPPEIDWKYYDLN